MLGRNKNKVRIVSAIVLSLLALGVAYAEDPLFGDLPDTLEQIDRALSDEVFGSLIRAVQNRVASEASVGGLSPGGFVFEIGALGLPVRTSSSLGTIWTNSAEPLGRGRLSISLSHTYLDFDSFDGDSLDDFLDFSEYKGRPVIPPVDIDLDLQSHIVGLSALYGLNENLETGLFLPLVFHRSQGDIFLLRESGRDRVGSAGGSTEGLGDIQFVSKYRLFKKEHWTGSVAGRLKLPSGDEDEYLGTGNTDLRLQFLLTGRYGNLQTNLDLGYTWNGFGRDYDSLNYRGAVAYALTSQLTVVGELIGSHSREEIFDTLDAGVGFKLNPTGGLVLQAGVRFPLNDNGLRAEAIPSVGLEWRF